MALSTTHIRLVDAILQWVDENHPSLTASILQDNPKFPGSEKPPKIGESIPDVFAEDRSLGQLLIGEAKTGQDLMTARSSKQFTSFLNYLRDIGGGMLIVSVEHDWAKAARGLLRKLSDDRTRDLVDIVVIKTIVSAD